MLQRFLIGRLTVVMATIFKIQRHEFVRIVHIHHGMVNMQHFVFELRLLQCLANKMHCIVTIAKRSK